MNILSIVACFVVSVLNMFAQKQERKLQTLRIITKALIVPSLLFVYFCFETASYPLLVAALIAGWFGDVFLMVPGKKPESLIEPMFIAGLLSFMVGHILYAVLFFQNSAGVLGNNILLVLPYLPYLLLVVFILNVLNIQSHLLLGGVALYMLFLTLMSFSALIRLISTPTIGPLFTFVGSMFFISSDLVLSLKMLGGKKDLPEEFIMSSYIAAQLLILLGFLL